MSYTPKLVAPTGGIYDVSSSSVRVPALQALLGRMQGSLCASGVDPFIVLAALIACASLLTQGVADVLWPNGVRASLSSPVYLVSPSGSGKSAIFNILVRAIRDFLSTVEAELKRSPASDFFVEDISREALVLHLHEWPYAGIFTDEGGLIERLLRNGSSILAKLIDGSPVGHARVSTGRVSLVGCRLTMFIAEQFNVFNRKLTALGAGPGGVGLINRCHLFKGSAGGSLHALNLGAADHLVYERRIGALLTLSIKNGQQQKTPLPAVPLSRLATECLIDISRHPWPRPMDPHLQAHAAEYVTRRAERILKLAAVLHVFEHGPEGEIDLHLVQVADQIGQQSIDAFLDLTYEQPKPTQVQIDAAVLERELTGMVQRSGQTAYVLKDLRRCAPNIGMTKRSFDQALTVLAGQGKVRVALQGRLDWLVVQNSIQRLFT